MVSTPAGSSSAPTTAEAIMTCPTCNLPLTPGAYCDGNGSHPPRRAKRLSRQEAAEARRLAAEKERARRAAEDAAEERRVRRKGMENPLRRRWQAQRGLLAAELSAAVAEGLATQEEADAWAAETAARLAKERAEQEARDAEAAARQPPAGFVAPFRYDGICYIFDANNEMAADDRRRDGEGWCARGLGRISYLPDADATMTAWVAWVAEAVGTDDIEGEEVARRMNVKAGWVEASEPPLVQPRQDPEPRRRTSHRGALFTVALVGALMGVGGVTGEKP